MVSDDRIKRLRAGVQALLASNPDYSSTSGYRGRAPLRKENKSKMPDHERAADQEDQSRYHPVSGPSSCSRSRLSYQAICSTLANIDRDYKRRCDKLQQETLKFLNSRFIQWIHAREALYESQKRDALAYARSCELRAADARYARRYRDALSSHKATLDEEHGELMRQVDGCRQKLQARLSLDGEQKDLKATQATTTLETPSAIAHIENLLSAQQEAEVCLQDARNLWDKTVEEVQAKRAELDSEAQQRTEEHKAASAELTRRESILADREAQTAAKEHQLAELENTRKLLEEERQKARMQLDEYQRCREELFEERQKGALAEQMAAEARHYAVDSAAAAAHASKLVEEECAILRRQNSNLTAQLVEVEKEREGYALAGQKLSVAHRDKLAAARQSESALRLAEELEVRLKSILRELTAVCDAARALGSVGLELAGPAFAVITEAEDMAARMHIWLAKTLSKRVRN